MKNEKTENREIENILKSKMNELSESVDCFDKISARVFPEKNQDFSESGFTISDLENITGKDKKFKTLKWTVIAAAIFFCAVIIPKTSMVHRIFSDIGCNSTKKIYQDLLTEINTETKNGNYISMDFPLNYYIDNDVLITPLFSCPFENCGKENLNVRIFIKQINGIYTNQVYAVEYKEEYSEKNIIAVAESEYKFTDDDIEDIEKTKKINSSLYNHSDKAITQSFSIDDNDLFTDNENNAVSLASFIYPAFIKDINGIKLVTNEILYGHKTMSDDGYFYDIISDYSGEKIQLPERQKMWKKSVYYNGNSAMPEKNISNFKMTELFGNYYSTETPDNIECIYISEYKYELDELISVYADKRLGTVIPPSYTDSSVTFQLYIPSELLSENGLITAKSNNGKIIEFISDDSLPIVQYYEQEYSIQQEEYQQKIQNLESEETETIKKWEELEKEKYSINQEKIENTEENQ